MSHGSVGLRRGNCCINNRRCKLALAGTTARGPSPHIAPPRELVAL